MEKLGKFLGGKLKERIRNAATGFKNRKEIKPVDRSKSYSICVFNSKPHLETWIFCSANKISLETWGQEHKLLFGKDPDSMIMQEPKTITLDRNGNISAEVYDRAQKRFPDGAKICNICFNTGFAYVIQNLIIFKNIPGELRQSICWCKRQIGR